MRLLLYGGSFLLFVNAILVVYKPLALLRQHDIGDSSKWIFNTEDSLAGMCCKCPAEPQRTTTLDHNIAVTSEPTLDPNYRTETLIRRGTDTTFDIQSCPPNSLMAAANLRNHTPLHDNCPSLYLVGARKAGTTSLYQYLSNHPDFQGTLLDKGPKAGETYYFSSMYDKVTWEHYLKYFPSDGVMTGDASVGNLVSCEVPQRIFNACGTSVKIVILLRNPINRFVSNFLMRARYAVTRIQNTTALRTVVRTQVDSFLSEVLRNVDITRMPQEWAKLRCLFKAATNLVFEGLYYVHVKNWLCNFPPENILIVNSEEFYRNTTLILNQVYQFLGLKPLKDETLKWITASVFNKGKYSVPPYQQLSTADRKKLFRVYESFNRALFRLLGWHDVQWN